MLSEAIESVLAQDANICEILVVDDASSDPYAAKNVADQFANQFANQFDGVRLIQHTHNRGGSAARNTGIDQAKGDLIALLDADDVWLPGKLAKQIRALLDFGSGEISPLSFCASNCLLESDNLRRPANHTGPNNYRPLWRYFLEEDCALQTSTLLLPAQLAKAVRFTPNLPRHQDWDFAIRLQQAGAQIVYLDECLSHYRLHDNPGRVSRMPKAARNSLVWFRQMRGRIPAPAMQRFFFTRVISRNAFAAPWSLILAVAGAAMLSPKTAISTMIASRRKPSIAKADLMPKTGAMEKSH